MPIPKLTKLELKVMDILWRLGPSPIREVQEGFPTDDRPAYTTVQTTIYRLEEKDAVRRVKKISNAHIFEAAFPRTQAQHNFVDELLTLFGGRTQTIISHLIETGKLTLDDIHEAEKTVRELAAKKEKSK